MNNKKELLDVLNNFYISNDNVILIDGKWGSGKTYLIRSFIEEFHEVPVYYVSMLGLRNVDEINTSLYMEVEKEQRSKVLSLIPCSINPFRIKEDISLDFTLKKDNIAQYLVIFDDFERYGSSDYDEFLSYVSNLLLAKVKIIVVSNIATLGGGEQVIFNDFKEKIFDHIYKAELFSPNLVIEKFNEFTTLIKDSDFSMFGNNYRVANKTYEFMKLISKETEFLSLKSKIRYNFLKIVSYFISAIYRQTKINYYDSSTIRASIKTKNKIKNIYKDDFTFYEVLYIYEYFLNFVAKTKGKLKLSTALYNAYCYGNYEDLNIYIKSLWNFFKPF